MAQKYTTRCFTVTGSGGSLHDPRRLQISQVRYDVGMHMAVTAIPIQAHADDAVVADVVDSTGPGKQLCQPAASTGAGLVELQRVDGRGNLCRCPGLAMADANDAEDARVQGVLKLRHRRFDGAEAGCVDPCPRPGKLQATGAEEWYPALRPEVREQRLAASLPRAVCASV
eukprot:CAMPEP_0195071276 /NCGR_PEP_ID=MMETSP0448-20130528/15132_1 /TAXON_ID=66468 /ORGANISM="Heterocapsa triquestra, Strain CCMP 448" /LENGTH=170 /DNA_ID=CAMNT_0040103107 /DNA_START=61 /DNA_END=570 /DNA_ORIENTATION=+